jgi:cbb3-type cytochrome oxidase cytochrome c subunit
MRIDRTAWKPTFVGSVAMLALLVGSPVGRTPALAELAAVPDVPGVDRGEWLLTELKCVACHDSPALKTRGVPGRIAPDLSAAGGRLTPQWIRSFLTNPQQAQPGVAMPDLLHGVEAKSASIDALVHYLMSLGSGAPADTVAADESLIAQGQTIYHRVGCVACHPPYASAAGEASVDAATPGGTPSAAAFGGVPLANLARKSTVTALAAFLVNPLGVRPSGRMPSLNLSEAEAKAVAMYLVREQAAPTNTDGSGLETLPGLRVQYFEGPFNEAPPEFDKLMPKTAGSAERFSLKSRLRNTNFALRFSGTLRLDREGEYTFCVESDDGARLYLGDRLVVNNDGYHPATEANGKLRLSAGEHPIVVTYFNGGADHALKVSYAGPGLAKREIPTDALSHQARPMRPLDPEAFRLDASKAGQGRHLFRSLGCAACHAVEHTRPPAGPAVAARPLTAVDPNAAGGCLAPDPAPGRPRYALDDGHRQLLRARLQRQSGASAEATPAERVAQHLATFNCYACHARGGAGGPAGARADYFGVLGEADLGDEGRLPPHLDGVGAKLRPEWVREVLAGRGAARPYMATRMPQFGAANIDSLAALFERADDPGATAMAAAPPAAPAKEVPALVDAKGGRALVGVGGLGCITCHTFAAHKSLGIPAMDLTLLPKRLKQPWFERYLLDPAALRPGTRMPSFWPEGKSLRAEVLGGDTMRQVRAIWTYLPLAGDLGLPPGLVQGRLELVATNEPIIYRNFIAGAGTRAIGVGYPAKVNVAFDANQMRFALLWQGPFIDAARHRTGRGDGFEPPLGHDLVRLPEGAPFALLERADTPWPAAAGKAAGYRMRGYTLDAQRRPSFQYAYGAFAIEDTPVPRAGDLEGVLERRIVVRGESPVTNLWFRAAKGALIEVRPDGSCSVDGRVRIRFERDGGAGLRPHVRRGEKESELRLLLSFVGSEARFVEIITW